MLHTGLLSVTFRKLNVKEVIDLVVEAGLEAIEWGGDIHVPPGDLELAREVRRLTEDAGLKVASYGSYYRLGNSNYNFEAVLDSAVALGSPTIRIWAGNVGSANAADAWWEEIIQDTQRIASLAEAAGVRIAFEFHANTLTDTLESALKLLRSVNHTNVYTYWQPLPSLPQEEFITQIEELSPWLTNIHAYQIAPGIRFPLEDGEAEWETYLAALPPTDERFVMLEFVKDDSAEQFLSDAVILKRIVSKINNSESMAQPQN